MERARPDYYRVLQVDPAANPLVVQAAYRALAQIFHPDVFGDEDEMKKINAAWEVLGDPKRRREYDIEQAGRHAPQPGQAGGPHGAATRAPSTHSTGTRPAESATAGAPPGAARREPAAPPTMASSEEHAGPPQGPASGSVMRFGRYEGWSIGQIARVDAPFLEWLRRVPAGRNLKDEIDAALVRADGARRMGIPNRDSASAPRVHSWKPGAPTNVR